jgi:hypothetical protein
MAGVRLAILERIVQDGDNSGDDTGNEIRNFGETVVACDEYGGFG